MTQSLDAQLEEMKKLAGITISLPYRAISMLYLVQVTKALESCREYLPEKHMKDQINELIDRIATVRASPDLSEILARAMKGE